MIKYIQGDLFETEADIIAHGCNCKGGFGSGVAKIVATKYPEARHRYLDKHRTEGWILGDVQFVEHCYRQFIANCATQDDYLPRGLCHANYGGIRLAMERVKAFAAENKLTIAIPKIGAGLAGGDWTVIEKILEEVFSDYDITVYYL